MLCQQSERWPVTTEWDARTYHAVSDPQFAWGVRVLDRLAPAPGESVLDAGCGSGRLTLELARRVPGGRVVAVDRSRAMLDEAHKTLRAVQVPVHFVLADLTALPLLESVDAAFSTATFHWVLDHARLFAGLRAVLRPGGRLVAQCGGHGNLACIRERTGHLLKEPRWRRRFAGWQDPWELPSPETTRERLSQAGFTDVVAWAETSPQSFENEVAFMTFLSNVVLRLHLARLADDDQRRAFVGALARQAARDDPPFTLDYVRLNLEARTPGRP